MSTLTACHIHAEQHVFKQGTWVVRNGMGMEIALCRPCKHTMEEIDRANHVINIYRELGDNDAFTPTKNMQLPGVPKLTQLNRAERRKHGL
jgi:hypothetical protein